MDKGSIEIGFADAKGAPLSHAFYATVKDGTPTPGGYRMQDFLTSIGGATSQPFNSLLKPGQWQRLVRRLGQIQNPTVPTTP